MEFALYFVILEFAKTERLEALKVFDYVALRKRKKYVCNKLRSCKTKTISMTKGEVLVRKTSLFILRHEIFTDKLIQLRKHC